MSLFLFMVGCQDAEESITYESTGQLIGLDMTLTPCSGGFVLVIDNDSASYRIEEFPSDFELELSNSIFPLDVQLNWTFNRQCAWNTFIDVDDIDYIE